MHYYTGMHHHYITGIPFQEFSYVIGIHDMSIVMFHTSKFILHLNLC